jgi:hypothetical protein
MTVWQLLLVVSISCEDSAVPLDGAIGDAESATCSADRDCTDDGFCNGIERCRPEDDTADVRGCVASPAPACLAEQSCDETTDECVTDCSVDADADDDGFDSQLCGGVDCDDANPARHPGAAEVCDADDIDEDCDPTTYGARDADEDGFADARCCNGDRESIRRCGADCNDSASGIHPANPETCNALDDDCDASTDEGVLTSYYADADLDGYGDRAPTTPTTLACRQPAGFAPSATDCDDARSDVHPGAGEICDVAMTDEDCSGVPNDRAGGCDCLEPGSRACAMALGACASGAETCLEGAWSRCSIMPRDEMCNDADDDCDGRTDEGLGSVACFHDGDLDAYAPPGAATMEFCGIGGCPSGWTARAPGITPGGADSDCNDGNVLQRAWSACRADGDGDEWGAGSVLEYVCANGVDGGGLARGGCAVGRANNGGDCCDTDGDSNPAATSYSTGPRDGCGGYDFDCDGVETLRDSAAADASACESARTPAECGDASGTPGWSGAVPGCGAFAPHYGGGCRWIGTPRDGECGPATATSGRQSCR